MRKNFPVNRGCISLLRRELKLRVSLAQDKNGRLLKSVQVFIEDPWSQHIPPFVSRHKPPNATTLTKGSARADDDFT